MKFALQLVDTKPFRKLKTTYVIPSVPACKRFDELSDQWLRCVARQITSAMGDLVGTCKMGPASDSKAVVDPRLRVHGVRDLRVIDTSVIPQIPTGNAAAATIMVAEKGAAMIMKDHRLESRVF